MIKEIWKDVIGFESFYLVSNLGQIARKLSCSKYMKNKYGISKYRLMQANPSMGGYVRVGLSSGGVRRTKLVHVLVAEVFIGPNPEGLDVNHKDGNKANNHVTNLEYVTRKQNIDHAYQTGLSTNFGENNYYSKLTTEDVLEIRRLHREGIMGYKRLARLFEIDSKHVSNIVKRIKWKHV